MRSVKQLKKTIFESNIDSAFFNGKILDVYGINDIEFSTKSGIPFPGIGGSFEPESTCLFWVSPNLRSGCPAIYFMREVNQ